MGEAIEHAGRYASAITAVIALATAILWKPIFGKLLRRRKGRREAEQNEQKEFQTSVLGKLEELGKGVADVRGEVGNIRDDVAALQCDRLQQAHDHWMEQGYCPSETKQVLVSMHQAYRSRGYNHLCDHYEDDILNLPHRRDAAMTL
jgi:gas vesicle protein